MPNVTCRRLLILIVHACTGCVPPVTGTQPTYRVAVAQPPRDGSVPPAGDGSTGGANPATATSKGGTV